MEQLANQIFETFRKDLEDLEFKILRSYKFHIPKDVKKQQTSMF